MPGQIKDKIKDENALLMTRLLCYALLIIFALVITISMGIMMERFSGQCVLNAEYNRTWLTHSDGECIYPMVIASLIQILYLLFRWIVLILLKMDKIHLESRLLTDNAEVAYAVIDCLAFFLTFVGACIISRGLAVVCASFNDCGIFSWYGGALTALVCAWISTLLWLLIASWGVAFVLMTDKILWLNNCFNGQTNSSGSGNQQDNQHDKKRDRKRNRQHDRQP